MTLPPAAGTLAKALCILRASAEDESHFYVAFPSVGHCLSPSPVPGCLSPLDLQVLNVSEPSVPLSNAVRIGRRLRSLLGEIARQRHAGERAPWQRLLPVEDRAKNISGCVIWKQGSWEVGIHIPPVPSMRDIGFGSGFWYCRKLLLGGGLAMGRTCCFSFSFLALPGFLSKNSLLLPFPRH